jgi:signal peptidase complex subunit 3
LQELNRVVVWDRVVTRVEDAHLLARGNFSKYPVFDQRAELRGRLVNLTLHWDIMPYTGILFTGTGGRFSARLPDAYCEGDAATCAFGEVLEETTRGSS